MKNEGLTNNELRILCDLQEMHDWAWLVPGKYSKEELARLADKGFIKCEGVCAKGPAYSLTEEGLKEAERGLVR